MLFGVTRFFRDPAAWASLRAQIFPAWFKDQPPGQALRAWIPACATGEEAYSLAIVFREALEQLQPARKQLLQIFATDLDREAIERARTGMFPASLTDDVSPERLSRFFVQARHGYQVSQSLRESVISAPQNVVMDPPFTKLDLVSCRNLLIYLTSELQQKLLPLFHYSLNPGGVLFLGSAENRQLALVVGADTFLGKPFCESDLLATLKELAGVDYHQMLTLVDQIAARDERVGCQLRRLVKRFDYVTLQQVFEPGASKA